MPSELPEWLGVVVGEVAPTDGDRLRHWGISETWRIRWTDGSTTIVKRGAGEQARELDVYQHLLIPYRITSPRLLASHQGDGFAVLVLEDLGLETLEARLSAEGTHAAARLLARLRHDGAGRLGAAGEFRFATPEITNTWVRAATALATVRPDLAGAIDGIEPLLGPHLTRLSETVPETILHGDFEPKNLILGAGGPQAIDWSGARVGAHLGDLYSLIRDVGRSGASVDGIAEAFAGECATLGAPVADLEWQLALGGLVWTVKALRWVLDEGIRAIPEALGWIDELVERAGNCAKDLAEFS
jgi:hypothetical protein